MFKTLRVFDLQNKIERGDCSYTRDLLQPERLRIFCPGQDADLTLEHGNAPTELGQRLHAWSNHRSHHFGQSLHRHLVETFTGRITHRVTQALEAKANRIDQGHPRTHQTVTQFDAQQILLRFLAPVANRIEQRAIHPPDARQHQRVPPIALAFMLINRPHLARIGHNHLPTQPFQVSTDPWAMRSGFHHGQGPTVTGSQSGQASSIVTQSAFLLHFAFAIERTKPVPPLSQIQSYRDLTLLMLLLHRQSSLPKHATLRRSPPSHLIWLGAWPWQRTITL